MTDIKSAEISIALLAGGKSSRMGKDKALLTYDGKTFLERLIEEFCDFDEILVSVRDENQYELEKYGKKVKVIADEKFEKGPLEGIRRALSESKNDFVFVSAADMPFMTKDLPQYIADFLCSDYDLYLPLVDGRAQPLCAVYKKSLLPVLENQLAAGELKLSLLFDKVRTKFISMEKSSINKKIFLNVNTPREYAGLQKPFIFCVSGIKNSGKTRMVCALLKEAEARGLKCAVIKHDGHDCFTDAPATDTFLFEQAGAVARCIFSDKRFMFAGSLPDGAEKSQVLGGLINQIKQLADLPDFIIIEGMKDSAYPKVEVMRRGISEKSVCKEPVICRVFDDYEPREIFEKIQVYQYNLKRF